MLASQLVPPAVGDPLSKPDTRDLTAQLGLEAAAGLAGAGGHCTLELAQLGPHVCIERAGDGEASFMSGFLNSRKSAPRLRRCQKAPVIVDPVLP